MRLLKITYIVMLILFLFCGCDDFIAEDVSEDQVTIIAPKNTSTISNIEINFSWEYLDGATSYHLQVVYPNFEYAQKLVLDTVISKNNFTKTLGTGEYEWRLN